MELILISWILLLITGLSYNKGFRPPFAQEQSAALRGICAIEIMIGHIGLITGSMVLYPNRKAGILFVGIFFILSGYGVAYSTDHKVDYLKHFLAGRTVKLLLPLIMVKVIMLTAAHGLSGLIGGGYFAG